MNETVIFGLITNSGEAKSLSMEALKAAKDEDYTLASNLIKEAEEKLSEAHKLQTQLIQAEAGGEELTINILLIHAQDHLMNAITVKDLVHEMIDMYKRFSA